MCLLSRILFVLVAFQMALATPTYRELLDLADLLAADKRLTDEALGDFINVCRQNPLELGLVIDSSSSIHPADFKKGQDFLKDFLSVYDIGSGKSQVRVAAVTYGYGVYETDAFNLNTYKLKDEVLQAIQNMPFRAGLRTDTGDAIKYMREVQMAKTRDGVPKVVIVLTDGNSQRRTYTAEQAALTRDENVTIFAVGVGRSVTDLELLNIAGDKKRVFKSESYEDLKNIKDTLEHKTCELVPKPTTTTTTTTTPPPPMEEPCGLKYPSDINFIFSPASLGLDTTSWVTQFISHTVNNEELADGFQYGVVSGSCPADAGFPLNMYSSTEQLRDRLDKYDRNNLPVLVSQARSSSFSAEKGGRSTSSKVAVIFLGKAKVDQTLLNKAINEMLSEGINVFVSLADSGISVSLPERVRLLQEGSSISQSQELVEHICHLSIDEEKLEEIKEEEEKEGTTKSC